jgi:hypothetical protein
MPTTTGGATADAIGFVGLYGSAECNHTGRSNKSCYEFHKSLPESEFYVM